MDPTNNVRIADITLDCLGQTGKYNHPYSGRGDIFSLTQPGQALSREETKIHAYFMDSLLFLEQSFS